MKRLSKDQREMLAFLTRHPDQWHTYGNDSRTLKAVAGLFFYRGLGVRGLYVDRDFHMMKLISKEFGRMGFEAVTA